MTAAEVFAGVGIIALFVAFALFLSAPAWLVVAVGGVGAALAAI